MLHPPFMADYAAGDKALQVWYRDRTVRWLRWERMAADSGRTVHGALEFQAEATPPFRRIEPEALRLLSVAGALERRSEYAAAVDTLTRAAAVQRDREAHHLLGRILGLRAWCLGGTGRVHEAEVEARRSLAIAPENADGHLTMSAILNGRGEWTESLRHLDTLETWYPGYPAAVEMRKGVFVRMNEGSGIEVGRRVPATSSPR
jgi:tetratricopeptide (TPR) repeat protein